MVRRSTFPALFLAGLCLSGPLVSGARAQGYYPGSERAESALALVREFDTAHPKSPTLNDARAEALKLLAGVEDEEVRASAAKVAAALKAGVVVVNFWATWCVPCRAEHAHLKERYEKYHGDGLEIVGVSLGEKEELAARYIKNHKIEWRQVVGETARKFAEEWGVEHIPMQFVLDRKGRLRTAEAVGKLDQLIPELLAERE